MVRNSLQLGISHNGKPSSSIFFILKHGKIYWLFCLWKGTDGTTTIRLRTWTFILSTCYTDRLFYHQYCPHDIYPRDITIVLCVNVLCFGVQYFDDPNKSPFVITTNMRVINVIYIYIYIYIYIGRICSNNIQVPIMYLQNLKVFSFALLNHNESTILQIMEVSTWS